MSDPWLAQLEDRLAEDDENDTLAVGLVLLASVAGRDVPIDEEEVHAATRRALLLLTAGGDPDRGLDLNGRAVVALADDLDNLDRRSALRTGLLELRRRAKPYDHVCEALRALNQEPDVAWRAYACSLLASSMSSE